MSQPDWIAALAAECARTSQSAVAKRLHISSAVVCQVLKGRYTGRNDRVERRVRGELMRDQVVCPVLGTISSCRCEDEQSQPYSTASRLSAAVWHACRDGCPHFRIKKDGA